MVVDAPGAGCPEKTSSIQHREPSNKEKGFAAKSTPNPISGK
jgi:hypothetical protein